MSPILGAQGGLSARSYGFLGNTVVASLNAYESIATSTPSGTGTATFSVIPGTYKHLQIRVLAKSAKSALNDYMQLRINGDTTTSNYRSHALDGDGSGYYSETAVNDLQFGWLPGNTTSGTFGVGIIDILDYTSTSKYKTIKSLGGFDQNSTSSGSAWIGFTSGLWMNSASPITSISINSASGSNYNSGTHFALYGIKG